MNVVIYARYSSHNQNEQSIEGQLNVCYEFAKKNSYTVIGEYIDRAISGKTDNRPQFKQMIEDSKNRQFQGILIYQLDRFARNRYDSAIYRKILKDNGVRIFSAMENISDAPYAVLIEGLLDAQSEYYSLELSNKVKRGMKTNASKCYYNGGSVPLGLKLETVEIVNGPMGKKISKKRFVIDEEKAWVVQEIFNMYINGNTMTDIIRYLNERQIKTSQGNKFNKNSLRKILLNKRYIGIYSYDGEEIKDGIPRIIEDDVFYKVQEKMEKNKEAPARAKAKAEYLLTTKLFCGTCKSMMTGYSGTSKTGKLHCYYECKGTAEKKCNRKNIKKEYIEDIVVIQARNMLTDEYIEKIANIVVKLADKEKDKTNINALEKLLKDNEKQKANLFDSLKICEIDSVKKSIFEEIAKMEEERKRLEKQIITEKNNCVQITVEEVKFFLKHLAKGRIEDIRYRKMLINVLIDKVYVYDDNLTIVFSTQDKHYEERIPTLSELESSFLGNQPPPYYNKN